MEKSKDQERQYLWVNKNEASASLTKGDASESKAIFQFVQHQRSDVPHRADDGRYVRRSLAPRLSDVPSAKSMQGRLRLSQFRSPPRYGQSSSYACAIVSLLLCPILACPAPGNMQYFIRT